MLTAQLTLDDQSGDATVYELRRYLSDGSERILGVSTLTEPQYIVIQHTTSGAGPSQVHRHLVSGRKTVVDSNGVPRQGTVNVTFSQPVSGITNQMLIDLFANLVDLLTDGGFGDSGMTGVTNVTAILQGQS